MLLFSSEGGGGGGGSGSRSDSRSGPVFAPGSSLGRLPLRARDNKGENTARGAESKRSAPTGDGERGGGGTDDDNDLSAGLRLYFVHVRKKLAFGMEFPDDSGVSAVDESGLGLPSTAELDFIDWRHDIEATFARNHHRDAAAVPVAPDVGKATDRRGLTPQRKCRTRFISAIVECTVVGDRLTRVLQFREYVLPPEHNRRKSRSAATQHAVLLHLPRVELASNELTNYAMAWAVADESLPKVGALKQHMLALALVAHKHMCRTCTDMQFCVCERVRASHTYSYQTMHNKSLTRLSGSLHLARRTFLCMLCESNSKTACRMSAACGCQIWRICLLVSAAQPRAPRRRK